MVARLVRDEEVVGSNPATPTVRKRETGWRPSLRPVSRFPVAPCPRVIRRMKTGSSIRRDLRPDVLSNSSDQRSRKSGVTMELVTVIGIIAASWLAVATAIAVVIGKSISLRDRVR